MKRSNNKGKLHKQFTAMFAPLLYIRNNLLLCSLLYYVHKTIYCYILSFIILQIKIRNISGN